MAETELLERIKNSYKKILGEKLAGLYVHGSIAFRCFHWNNSDIDFLVVVNNSLSLEEKEALLTVLLELDAWCPPKGLEMSVVSESVCNDFCCPVPFELHFSNAHKESCKTDLTGYCRSMNGVDKDLAAHFTVIRKVGIALYGKDIHQVFGDVPKRDYLDSIKSDIEHAADEIDEDPVYNILNLYRVLAYIRDVLVLSKEQGGRWGKDQLPKEYHPVIQNALNSYCVNEPYAADHLANKSFAEYMLCQIFTN